MCYLVDMTNTRAIVASMLCAASAAGQDKPAASGYLIRNVRVVDVAAGRVTPGQDVQVSGDRIARVAPSGPGAPPAGVTVIDG